MNVRTGASGGRGGIRVYSGRRPLCPACAARQQRSNAIWFYIAIAMMAAIVVLYLLIHFVQDGR